MPVRAQSDAERLFDVADPGGHVQHDAALMRAHHGEAISLRELDHRLILLLRRTKALGELLRGEVAMIVRTVRILQLAEESAEFGLAAQRQSDSQRQIGGGWQKTVRCQPGHRRRDVPAQGFPPHRRAIKRCRCAQKLNNGQQAKRQTSGTRAVYHKFFITIRSRLERAVFVPVVQVRVGCGEAPEQLLLGFGRMQGRRQDNLLHARRSCDGVCMCCLGE